MNGSVCVYIYIHILSDLIHMRPYVHVFVHMYASTLSVCVCTYPHSSVHEHVYMYMHVHSDLIHMRPHVHVFIHMYASTRACISLCACVHISTWLYAFEWIPPLPPSTLPNQAPQCRQLAVAQRVKGGSQGHVCNTSILRYVSQ